ncbi:hypothetical protein DIZ76_014355 [Coccidioides immitis]|nr:hypothetical protein DIZ76_014355 [Coccidioides immitis]
MEQNDSLAKVTICALPNEILYCILEHLWTEEIVHLSTVSRRFYAVVASTVRQRLCTMVGLEKLWVGLIYYPPQQGFSSLLFCRYLGKRTLEGTYHKGELYTDSRQFTMGYSRFCPEPQKRAGKENTDASTNHEEHSAQGSSEEPSAAVPRPFVRWLTTLDDFEPFSQLCVDTHLFWKYTDSQWKTNQAHIEDGTARFWRKWLDDQLEAHYSRPPTDEPQVLDNFNTACSTEPDPEGERIIWVGTNEDIGLKLRVMDKAQDDPFGESASYELLFEEILIRNNRLLLALERTQKATERFMRDTYRYFSLNSSLGPPGHAGNYLVPYI